MDSIRLVSSGVAADSSGKVKIEGFGVTIKDHTKKNAKLMMPNGVKEELYLEFKEGGEHEKFNITYPDTNNEMRAGAEVTIEGLPNDVVHSLRKVAGTGTTKQVDVMVVAYVETTNSAKLTNVKRVHIKMYVRSAAADKGVIGVIADKSKIDNYNADGVATSSLNLDPKQGTVTN